MLVYCFSFVKLAGTGTILMHPRRHQHIAANTLYITPQYSYRDIIQAMFL
jgi:hypothetical protein